MYTVCISVYIVFTTCSTLEYFLTLFYLEILLTGSSLTLSHLQIFNAPCGHVPAEYITIPLCRQHYCICTLLDNVALYEQRDDEVHCP